MHTIMCSKGDLTLVRNNMAKMVQSNVLIGAVDVGITAVSFSGTVVSSAASSISTIICGCIIPLIGNIFGII